MINTLRKAYHLITSQYFGHQKIPQKKNMDLQLQMYMSLSSAMRILVCLDGKGGSKSDKGGENV